MSSMSANQHFYTTTPTTHPNGVEQQHQQQTPVTNGFMASQPEPKAMFYLPNGQSTKTPSPPTPDTPPLSQHGSNHNLHRNGSSGDLSLHRLQRGGSSAGVKTVETCRVCGDSPARPHYGVPTCFGCKGFFRRTLKRTKEYTCRYNGNCVVDRYERNSCRYCRFKRCLDCGMDPKAVRPDRDAAGRSHPIRHRRSRVSLGELGNLDDEDPTDEWIRKLPVDMRTLLMQIMNIDLMVNSGDTHVDPSQVYPLQIGTLRNILEDPTLLDGKRTEMSYEPYRKVKAEEMVSVAHRRLIAVIDMVDHLCVLMDLHNIHDKLALVKAAYAPLALFCTVAATAKTTRDRNVFCLCCCGYLERGTAMRNYEEPYHFTNRIVERALDELVEPFRAFNFKDQEIALMKAIVTLNPHIRALSTEAAEQVADLRDRVQETLYNVVRESHPKEVASSRFGNLLLFLPNIMLLGTTMYENLQFMQSFSQRKVDPLLIELLDCLEPMQDPGVNADDIFGSERADSRLRASMSNSSLSSMGSHESFNGQQNGQIMNEYYTRRQSAEPCIPLSTSAPTCIASSFPNHVQQAQQQQDSSSDADYNLTLTAESFSGMRQAIAQSMEIDQGNMDAFYVEQPNGIAQQNGHSSNNQQTQKPRFYIDSYQSQQQGLPQVHTTIGARHIFTVEPIKDLNYSIAGQIPQSSVGFQVPQGYSTNTSASSSNPQQLEMNPPVPSMSKSQSFPYFSLPQQQAQLQAQQFSNFQQFQQNNYEQQR
ncbi:Zinc finger, C4 type [Aphelenchoides bicaudatus]|nr:Zinc finger, C4 type [Aphelenchoides bicaudatus]